ncbi:methyltransferase [Candidatus Nanosalina sp. VS9-1]|uniref:methyltransferase n=1 Tax=Candidatus Nanosalina sp. VS9-1 TaxID=3388566 RepID=UPI0039E19328
MHSAPYEIKIRADSGEASKEHSFRSAPGISRPETALREEIMLLKAADIETTSSVLVIDSRIGIEGVVIGDRARNGRVMMTSSRTRETLLSELNRKRNDPEASTEVMLTSNISKDSLRKYERAVYAPRDKDPLYLVKQKMVEASQVLRDSGILYISSSSKVASKLKDFASEFGEVRETVENGVSVLEITVEEASTENVVEESRLQHSIKGEKAKFKALKGLFTGNDMNRVEMLSREISSGKGKLLDASCGFGLVGIFASKLYGYDVDFTDRDRYMTDYTENNASLNNLEDFEAFTEDGVENFPSMKYDVITYQVSEGFDSKVFRQDMRDCFKALKKGGELFVAHRKDFRPEGTLRTVFGNCDVRRREFDFQVSSAEK